MNTFVLARSFKKRSQTSFPTFDKIALHAELSNTEQTNRSDGKKKQNYSLFPRSLRSLFLKRLLTYLFLPGSVLRDTKEFYHADPSLYTF